MVSNTGDIAIDSFTSNTINNGAEHIEKDIWYNQIQRTFFNYHAPVYARTVDFPRDFLTWILSRWIFQDPFFHLRDFSETVLEYAGIWV